MRVPFVLFLMSTAALLGSMLTSGFDLTLSVVTSALAMVAAALLLAFAAFRGSDGYIVVDGSNVMFWKDNQPSLDPILKVLAEAHSRSLTPIIGFDANVGYRLGDRYLGPVALARLLGLPIRHVFVAPKGTPADPLLLQRAARLRARVITNDRFRDWVDDHPQLQDPGFLIKGQMRDGALSLDA